MFDLSVQFISLVSQFDFVIQYDNGQCDIFVIELVKFADWNNYVSILGIGQAIPMIKKLVMNIVTVHTYNHV